MDVHTVARERRELFGAEIVQECARAVLGARWLEKTSEIKQIMEHDTAGDPITGVKWTH